MSRATLLCSAHYWTGEQFKPGCVEIIDEEINRVFHACSEHRRSSYARTYDLTGQSLLPGFVDGHAHPLIGGFEAEGVNIRNCETVQEIVQKVKQFAEQHPEIPWIIGEGFDLSTSPDGNYLAADLDAVVADRPVALRSSDIHTYWANTRALEIAGITRHRPDPIDGVIERDRHGNPSGTLREWGAFMPLYRAIPREIRGNISQALRRGLENLRNTGVTSVQDAWVELQDFPEYVSAALEGLPVRLNIALRAEPGTWRQQLHEFVGARDLANSLGLPRFSANTIKYFADGIIEGGTAHMKAPYRGDSCCGLPAWEEAELAEAVAEFDALGFQTHIHAIGDAGVDVALAAIENARMVNGVRDRRPVIAHAQIIDGKDYPRFLEQDVTFVFQPFWAKLDGVIRHLTQPRLDDERGTKQYAFNTAARYGIRLASSSDYPITTPNPLEAIAVAMSREEHGDMDASWLPEERLSFSEAVVAATQGSAYTQFAESLLGRIEPGFTADLVAVDGLSTSPTARELFSAQATQSWLGGSHLSHTQPERSSAL